MQIEDSVSQVLKTKASELWSVTPNQTVFEALELISARDIGCVLVMERDLLLGVFSEREYARNVALHGRQSRERTVAEVMFAPPVIVAPETRIDEAMRLMTEHHIRHLPVMRNGMVVGLLSMSDLVKWVISAQASMIKQLESYITGQYAHA